MTNKIESNKKLPAKRVDIVSIKMVKEKSVLYKNRRITSPEDIVELTREFIEDSDREKFIGIYLNSKNEPTALEVISTGSLNASIVHPREVFKSAIISNSNSMIFVHNHPSGNPTPSSEDIGITKRLKEGAELLGLKILDHIIIGDEKYYSFKEEGRL